MIILTNNIFKAVFSSNCIINAAPFLPCFFSTNMNDCGGDIVSPILKFAGSDPHTWGLTYIFQDISRHLIYVKHLEVRLCYVHILISLVLHFTDEESDSASSQPAPAQGSFLSLLPPKLEVSKKDGIA